jgi:hypothetical protein
MEPSSILRPPNHTSTKSVSFLSDDDNESFDINVYKKGDEYLVPLKKDQSTISKGVFFYNLNNRVKDNSKLGLKLLPNEGKVSFENSSSQVKISIEDKEHPKFILTNNNIICKLKLRAGGQNQNKIKRTKCDKHEQEKAREAAEAKAAEAAETETGFGFEPENTNTNFGF